MNIGISLIGITKKLGGTYQYAVNMLEDLLNAGGWDRFVVFYDYPELAGLIPARDNVMAVKVAALDDGGKVRSLCRLIFGLWGLSILGGFIKGRYRELEKYNCDVIFHPHWGAGSFVTNVPAIVAIHDCAPQEAPEILSWKLKISLDFLIRSIIRHAKVVLVDSGHGRDLLSRYYNISADRIAVLPFKPPSCFLTPKRDDRQQMRKFDIDVPYFFLPGRWGSYKNTQRVLAALKTAIKRGYDMHLVLSGILGDDEIGLANAEVARQGLEKHVHILGFVPDGDMPVLYRNALALIFPTLLGPTSIPIYEAMLVGCPVITSNISGYPQLVGDAGLLVDPYIEDEICAAMIKVYQDEALRKSMAEKGRARIKQTLEIDHGQVLMDLARRVARIA